MHDISNWTKEALVRCIKPMHPWSNTRGPVRGKQARPGQVWNCKRRQLRSGNVYHKSSKKFELRVAYSYLLHFAGWVPTLPRSIADECSFTLALPASLNPRALTAPVHFWGATLLDADGRVVHFGALARVSGPQRFRGASNLRFRCWSTGGRSAAQVPHPTGHDVQDGSVWWHLWNIWGTPLGPKMLKYQIGSPEFHFSCQNPFQRHFVTLKLIKLS